MALSLTERGHVEPTGPVAKVGDDASKAMTGLDVGQYRSIRQGTECEIVAVGSGIRIGENEVSVHGV